MSEYQYYEFRAVDQPLSQRQMDELRELSTRAEITPTSFSNVYHYGDFRGDPRRLMEKYFDAFVYVANWGTHWVMFRLPRALLDVETARPYCPGEGAEVWAKGEHVILSFRSDVEPEGWEEGEGWLDELLPVRAGLLDGDLRALYLGWLLWAGQARYEDEPEDAREPPVPPGLRRLSAPLERLAEFLRIDPDLLAAAAGASSGAAPAGPTGDEMGEWVRGLPEAEKDSLLLRLLEEESPHLRSELLRRFRLARERPADAAPEPSGRTLAELLAAADAHAEEERRREEEKAARERERREREQAAARALHLDTLARREPQAWREVGKLIATKQPKNYDQAVELLRDLGDVAARDGRTEEFRARLSQVREQNSRKPSLLARLDRANLKA